MHIHFGEKTREAWIFLTREVFSNGEIWGEMPVTVNGEEKERFYIQTDGMERSVECIFTGSDITESFVVKMTKSFEMHPDN